MHAGIPLKGLCGSLGFRFLNALDILSTMQYLTISLLYCTTLYSATFQKAKCQVTKTTRWCWLMLCEMAFCSCSVQVPNEKCSGERKESSVCRLGFKTVHASCFHWQPVVADISTLITLMIAFVSVIALATAVYDYMHKGQCTTTVCTLAPKCEERN